MAVTEDFIAGLPKAELHVHHVGSVSQRVVAELAARHPGTVPSDPRRDTSTLTGEALGRAFGRGPEHRVRK